MIILDIKNTQPIEELYAFISIDEDDNEGITNFHVNGQSYPMVFGYKSMCDKFKPLVKDMSTKHNKTVRLIKFKKVEVIETL